MEMKCYRKRLRISSSVCLDVFPPDHRKEIQTEVVWICLRSSGLAKAILQGTVKGGKTTRQTEDAVGRQHQVMDSSGIRQVPEDCGE